jgi:hypothetical protein
MTLEEFQKIQDLTQVDPSVFEKLNVRYEVPELDHWQYVTEVEEIEDLEKQILDIQIIYENKNTGDFVCIPMEQTPCREEYYKAYPVKQKKVTYVTYEQI